jgi:hypothetical protein
MKIQFDPETNEWELPQSELQTTITRSFTALETQKTRQHQNRKFILTLLFVVTSVVGATCVALWGQVFPILTRSGRSPPPLGGG